MKGRRGMRRLGAAVLAFALLFSALPTVLPAAAAEETVEKTAVDLVQDGQIRFHGRSRTVGGSITMDWTASGYEFLYTGGGTITARMTGSGQPIVRILVNGEERTVEVAQTKEIELARDLPQGTYFIQVLKQREAMHGLCQLDSLAYPADGQLQATPEQELKFEFLGDSITCGSETVGYQQHGSETYAVLTAQAFEADWNVISVSGYSLIDRTDRPASVAEIWEKESFFRDGGDEGSGNLAACADWDFDRYVPDVVVVNLGTNDNLGANMEQFLQDVEAFTVRLRKTYPNAQIVWAYGLMTPDRNHITRLKAAVDELHAQDPGVSFCEFPMMMSGVTDHPDAAEHRAAAKILSAHVAKLLGREDPLAGVDMEAQRRAVDSNADLSAVEQAVERALALEESAYLPNTWQALEEALAPAQEMLRLGGVPYQNYVRNESFEFDFEYWEVTDQSGGANAPVITFGSSAYDWQNAVKTNNGLCDYTLTQEITGLPDGRYQLSFFIQFGVYENSCFLRLESGGEEYTACVQPQNWDAGYQKCVLEADVTGGSCTVTVSIRCEVENGSNPMLDFVRLIQLPQDSADRAAEKLNAAVEGLRELTVDLSALNAAIAAAESKDASLYTQASWTRLQTALEEAKELLLALDEDALQSAVDAAKDALQAALDALVERADPTALLALIQEARAYRRSEYTTASWEALQAAIEQAAAVAEGDATAEQMADMVAALQRAIDGLVPGQPDVIVDTGFEGEPYTQEGTYTIDGVEMELGWGGAILRVGDDAYAGTNVLQLGSWGRASLHVDLTAGQSYRIEGYLRNRNATDGELRVWLMDSKNNTDSNDFLAGQTLHPAAGAAGYEKFTVEITVPETYTGGYLMLKWQDESSDGVYIDSLSVIPVGGGSEERQPGDVNGDGTVNSSDARRVLQATVRLVQLDPVEQEAADVNGDGMVNSNDARWILQATVELRGSDD